LPGVDFEDLGRRYTDAWNSRDPARVASFHAGDSSLQVNDDEPAVGHEAITEVARGFMDAFPDMELTMDGIEGDARNAVYRWTFAGTNTGTRGTGNAVRFSGYENWTLNDDGLITRSLGHFDADDFARRLPAASRGRSSRGRR
jgi:nuclear transport factor 2 (NTF2) superfamily protein